MSAIYFHTKEDYAKVAGAERAHFGVTASDLGWIPLRVLFKLDDITSPIRKIFPEDHYVHRTDNLYQVVRGALAVGNITLRCKDHKISPFEMNLNTMYYMGSDPLQLAARLHGQCEIHAYIEPENRDWIANIIRRGREFKFYRDGMGWEEVIELLENPDVSSVVTSYSVTETFPNPWVTTLEFDKEDVDRDTWYELPYDERWETSVEALRQSKGHLELTPVDWDEFYFGNGIDANQLASMLVEDDE